MLLVCIEIPWETRELIEFTMIELEQHSTDSTLTTEGKASNPKLSQQQFHLNKFHCIREDRLFN